MMISKFNKLIRNKAIWAVFAILISLAMVGLFAPSSDRGASDQDANTIGKLFGEPVSRQAFYRARLFAQGLRPERSDNPDVQERIKEDTWQRLAILKLAERTGVTVSDRELSEAIQRDPTFAVNGVFSRQRYQQLIEGQMRVRIDTFEAYLREELILRKMSNIAGQSLWVSPYELEQSVSRLTDSFTIQVATMDYSNAVADVSASEDQIKRFYQEHPDAFEVPEAKSVKYAEWPVSNYLAKADVSETDIQDYYDANLEDYAVTDTNESTTYTPLEEVRADIRHDLAWRQAISLASEDAMLFTDDLGDIGYDDDVTFLGVAAARNINIQTSALFHANGEVPGLNVGPSFVAAAYRLNAAIPEDSYSHTIVADDAIYVIASDSTVDAHVPPFEDAQEKAVELANDLARATAFTEKSSAARTALAAALSEKTFADAAKELDMPVTSHSPFSVYEATEDTMDDFSAIAPALLGLDKGELSEPIQTSTGAAVVYVADRQPGDIAMAESLKPDVARTIQSTRMRTHFAEWASDILADARGGEMPIETETYE